MPINSRLHIIDQKGKHSVRGEFHTHIATQSIIKYFHHVDVWVGFKKPM